MKINIDKNIILPLYRSDLTDYSHRYQVMMGGAGSGKSYYIAQKLLIKALSSKRRILVVRKYGTTMRDSVWRLCCDILSSWGLLSLCKANISIYVLTLPNGSEIICKGIDDPEKIKSVAGITDIWVEEASELSEDEITQLDLRLRADAPDQQIYYSYNPVSKANWTYKRYHAPDVTIPANCKIITSTYKDNTYLPESYITALEGMIRSNPTYYRIYVLGEYCSLDRLVYSNWRVEEFDEKSIKGQLAIGLDFGYVADPTSLIISLIENHTIYISDEHVQTGLLNDKIAEIIRYKGYAKEVIVADSAEPKSIDEIRRHNIPRIRAAAKGPDSVMHGIQRLQQYEIIVHPRCINTITELENYGWKKDKSGEYTNEPIDSYNHCLDALRYSLQALQTNKLQTMPKIAFGF